MLRRNKIARCRILEVVLVSILFLILITTSSFFTAATNSSSVDNATLTIYDETDEELIIRTSGSDVVFYANYTNTSSNPINESNGNGSCNIRFNFTSSYTTYSNMTFNSTSLLWEYNRSFAYKGVHYFEVNCTSNFGNITLEDSYEIDNTVPSIELDIGGTYIDWDGDSGTIAYWPCTEDTLCIYEFSNNVSDPDLNDVLTYNYTEDTNTSLTNFTIDSSSGNLTVNITRDENTGNKQVELNVKDTESALQAGILMVDISPVNDAPYFENVEDFTVNEKEATNHNFSATDEEEDVPYTFNVSFVNCTRTFLGTATGSDCEISSWNWTSGDTWLNLNFTSNGSEAGVYLLNLSVVDNETSIEPYNASNWTLVEFTVSEINDLPNLTYVCDNERNATEDSPFTCYVNATDEDERYNLTFSSNYSWFLDSITDSYNVSTDDHANATIDFTPTDENVGNWSIMINVTDTGNSTHQALKSDSQIISFFIENVNDSCSLDSISDQIAYESGLFSLEITAEDNDLLIPDKSVFNENITFSYSGDLTLDITKSPVVSNTNQSNATLSFTPDSGDIGEHIINVSITDISGNTDYQVFNITVSDNTPAQWNDSEIPSLFNLVEDNTTNINLSEYAYDSDGDDINFSYSLLDNFPSFSLNSDSGMIIFTPGDEDVGYHNVSVNVTDGKGAFDNYNFTFYVNYTLEAPSIADILDQNATEDELFTLYINTTDGDLAILDSIFNESLEFSHNSSLPFNISVAEVSGNLTRGLINFTPTNEDIGEYSINVTVNDSTGNLTSNVFVLNISEVNDPPYFLQNISDQVATVNETYILDINATDEESGNESAGNLSFTVNISWINSSMNHTTGFINVTPLNSSNRTVVEASVSDGVNTVSQYFNLTVYAENSAPYIELEFPPPYPQLNETSNETFRVRAQDSNTDPPNNDVMSVAWKLNNVTMNITSNYTGGSEYVTWLYEPNYSSETTGGDLHNLTVTVNDQVGFSDSHSWLVNVTHSNAPPVFSGTITNQSGTSGLQLNLNTYFSDVDHTDNRYNQSIGFSINQYQHEENWTSLSEDNLTTSSSISTSIDNDTYMLTFTASSESTSIFKITAVDSNDSSMNASSNLFKVAISENTEVVQTPSSGGGGSSSSEIVSLNLINPGPLKMYAEDTLVSTVIVENDGKVTLNNINLTLHGSENLDFELNETYISSLNSGEKKNITLTISSFKKTGDEEVIITGNVSSPEVSDSAKIHVTILDREVEVVKEKLAFVEELISDNPACLELSETVEAAKAAYNSGDYDTAMKLADQAVNACKAEVSSTAVKERREVPILKEYLPVEFLYFFILLLAAIIIVYYVMRLRVKRAEGKFKSKESDEEIEIKVE